MKFGEFKRMILDETGEDTDTNSLFDGLFEEYDDNDDVDLKELVAYIEDQEERVSEIADGLVDVYYSDLLDWYNESPNILFNYADSAIEELGSDTTFKILQGGQYLYFEELINNMIEMSLSIIETLQEEEQE